MPDDVGFDKAPDRYMTSGRETVDKMRDACHAIAQEARFSTPHELGELLFAAASYTHHLKYADRVKDPEVDPAKADWWYRMYVHVMSKGELPDPRSSRPDFVPYEKPHGGDDIS
jgi:hypothetical protein